jgi:hypothetical protein
VNINQVSVEARQFVHLYLSTDQETFNSGTKICGIAIMNEVQFSMNDQWHVGQEIRNVVFQESSVSLFGSTWGPDKLSPQMQVQILMDNCCW